MAATRIIFGEGHQVFGAADSTFAAGLTGAGTVELRRWVIGPEGTSRGRRRGLAARLADVASYDEDGARAIADAREAATALPGDTRIEGLVSYEAWLAPHDTAYACPPFDEQSGASLCYTRRPTGHTKCAPYRPRPPVTSATGPARPHPAMC